MRKAFVTGWPIAHSKSPIVHGYWLEIHGIDGCYEKFAVKPEDFGRFIEDLPGSGFVGGNITIPHKETAFEAVKVRDEAATLIGAVNTVWLEDGLLKASNTDTYGFAANLDDCMPRWREGKVATVLGAGGASRAVLHALVEAGFEEVRVVNRTLSRAEALRDRFRGPLSAYPLQAVDELLADSDLLVNTTSMGMEGNAQNTLPDLSVMKREAIITDIVYTPLMTPLLTAAERRGLATVDGLGMLLHQAVPGFQHWFGVLPSVTAELRAMVLEAA